MSEIDHNRSPELISAERSRLLILDVQQKLLPIVTNPDQIQSNCVRLLKGAKLLGVPSCAAEQYPRGLGQTIPEIAEFIPERPAKVRFSGAESFDWFHDPESIQSRHQIVLAGIETHVCVLQSAFNLISAGFDVYLVVDAIGTRFPIDHEIGLRRMSDAGVRLITTEMALFEWCGIAGTDTFKQLSKIVTNRESTTIPTSL